MSPALVAQRHRLDALFAKVRDVADLELQAHWSRYLCVLVSGFLETALQTIYSDYVRTRADARSARYARQGLERLVNPNMERILQLCRAFDDTWAENLEAFVAGARRDAVNSVVANRNRIAHGENVGISYVIIREYY